MYCAQALKNIADAGLDSSPSTAKEIFAQVQQQLLLRDTPIYVMHVRSHTSQMGPIFQGNSVVDAALSGNVTDIWYMAPEKAHSQYHLSARTLHKLYGIPRDQARMIVKRCANCVPFRPPPKEPLHNPKGDAPNALWQMDVTHFQTSLIHVSVDTYSGFIMATLQPNEATKGVIAHMLECFAVQEYPKH